MKTSFSRQRRGWDYIEEVGLIMAGSIDPESRIVELSTDGGQTFEHLENITWGTPSEDENAGPCVVILDQHTAFFVGGADGSTNDRTAYCDTYFLDLPTKQWTPGPNITHCRHDHTCSLINNDTTGHREVVVVGGWEGTGQGQGAIQEVEIIDLDTLQVRNGEKYTVFIKLLFIFPLHLFFIFLQQMIFLGASLIMCDSILMTLS